MQNRTIKAAAALGLLIGAPLVQADDFTGFSMNFVDIGNTTNVDDDTGYGAVGYSYQIGVNEVSEGMISAYNTANPGEQIAHDGRGADKPATSVSWNDAARFVNWLNTSQGYQAAYKESGTGDPHMRLWSSANAWQTGGENLFRHKDAHYFLPSEDEWYKAAYYDGDTETYYNYATGSDTLPTAVAGGTTPGTAVYNEQVGPADISNAGDLSKYGTMAQTGNVSEWGESAFGGSNLSGYDSRVVLGGDWSQFPFAIESSYRTQISPAGDYARTGFRVAAVPEPSSTLLLGAGALTLLARRRRKN